MTTRINYDHELTLLNDDIKQMGYMVESSIEQCFIAFEDQDFEKAEGIIRGDRTINDLERSIEARCLSLILRQQPVAGDLRVVSSALKVVTPPISRNLFCASVGSTSTMWYATFREWPWPPVRWCEAP